MSYIPTEWKTGDIVTAEKLNKLEEGVASGGGGGGDALLEVVKTGAGVYTLGDISYNDVRALLAKGIVPIAHYTENDGKFHEFSLFYQIGYNDGTGYSVDFNDFFFNSETADGTLRYVMD